MAELRGTAQYRGGTVVPDNPVVFTRFEKGQALTHAEMDTNLTSLLHTCSVSASSIKEGDFILLEYASQSLEDGQIPEFVREPIKIQTSPSAQQVVEKIANEIIPGNLGVSGSVDITNNLTVGKDLQIGEDLWVSGTLHVNKVIYEKDFVGEQSDARLKHDIRPLVNALDAACQIEPVRFIWNDEAEKEGHDVGVIAQQVLSYYPEAVHQDSNGYLRVDYVKLVPLLLGAIQELSERFIRLEEKIRWS